MQIRQALLLGVTTTFIASGCLPENKDVNRARRLLNAQPDPVKHAREAFQIV
jgi:hypothetical protein